jgi:serine phosphatase RsbU (regulator of sigma subunit)
MAGTPALQLGVASLPLPGEPLSGDLHVVQAFPGGALVAVVDGLGHGADAAAAAQRAVAELAAFGQESVISLVRRCHQALTGTRGVVMCLASFNGADDTMTWLGIGNVAGLLLHADARSVPQLESVVMRGGVVGYELPPLRAAVTTLNPGDLLVLATDGIKPEFSLRLTAGAAPQALADEILSTCAKGTDDALVLVARYQGTRRAEP